MPDENQSIGGVNLSGSTGSNLDLDNITANTQAGRDIIGRDQNTTNIYPGAPNPQDQQLAQDRYEETLLQNYLDKMTELLLPPNNLRSSPVDSELRTIARARTLTVLRGLNAERKGNIVQFLSESKLIKTKNAIVGLAGVNLKGANLRGANLRGADLSGANLMGSHLNGARLSRARLSEAILIDAILIDAILIDAILNGADLSNAILSNAILSRARLSRARLNGGILNGADLRRADLSGANLSGANLSGANLSGANLSETDLTDTNLTDVISNENTKWPWQYDKVAESTR